MAQIKVTLVKSTIGSTQTQKDTVAALGLKKIRSCRVHEDTPAILTSSRSRRCKELCNYEN